MFYKDGKVGYFLKTFPACFLDRDGVLNELVFRDGGWYSPRTEAQFRLNFHASKVSSIIQGCGYFTVVISNQPDIGRGLMQPAELELIEAKLRRELQIDLILTCRHAPESGCQCRKPQTGLVSEACKQLPIDLTRSLMVGDRASDLILANRCGMEAILLRSHQTSNDELSPLNFRFRVIDSLGDLLSLPEFC